MPASHVLMLFLKEPVPGRVKTRLAERLGDKKACAIYKGLVKMLAERIQSEDWELQVWYHSEKEPRWLKTIWGNETPFFLQRGSDLGERMSHAFSHNFTAGAEKVLILGGDSPDLPLPWVSQSFDILNIADVVLGPSEDGGYYLLAMNQHHPEIFEDIPWSTPEVLPLTLKKLKQNQTAIHLLPVWQDVDTVEDYRRFQEKNPEFQPLHE